jgi:ATP adenylyltransferase/5',5'''-P-1,P-4-tetraphosphate phosphorylase II
VVTAAISKKPYIKDNADEQGPSSTSLTSLPPSSSSSSGSTAAAAAAAPPAVALPGYVKGSDINVSGYEIGDVSETHMLAFNKFCMYRPHLLLLTKDGTRRQYEALDIDDLQSAWATLDALGWRRYFMFFNCGKDGGCSRLHKHLQLAPYLPDRLGPWPSVAASSSSASSSASSFSAANVPYEYILRRFDADLGPKQVMDIYAQMLGEARQMLGLDASAASSRNHVPHNLALGRNWILVIPRTKAGVDGAYGNTLGMLGMVSVASHDELDCWLRQGPNNVVAQLGVAARRTGS